MVGIKAFGAYIPKYRLDRNEMGKAWGGRGIGGERAVAYFDEDSITMATEAAMDCLTGIDPKTLGGLYFASTTAPYREKQCSSLIATALDMGREIRTADFTDSLRSGTIAVNAAIDAVESGRANNILVTVADTRQGVPESNLEQAFGDGAAAVLISDSDVVASVAGCYTISDEFIDFWRRAEDTFVLSWEERFIKDLGYRRNVQEGIAGVMKQCNVESKDIAKAVIYAPETRSHQRIARGCGFDMNGQVQDLLFNTVGITGTAHSLMMLASALETAKPGDNILLVSYGDGCDAFVLEVQDGIKDAGKGLGVSGHLASKDMLGYYGQFMRYRNLVNREAARRPPGGQSAPTLYRERDQDLALYGQKCSQCSNIQWPLMHVCSNCQAKDDFEKVKLSKEGTVFTFTHDYLTDTVEPPATMSVIDLKDGGRVYCMMTDRNLDEVKADMPVEMTFRLMHENAGIKTYFWKARPKR